MEKHSKHSVAICIIAITIIGGGAFFAGMNFSSGGNASQQNCNPVHNFINPNFDCMNVDLAYAQIRSSQEKVQLYISDAIGDEHASRISVSFRDLKTNRWFGINENDSFSPGSLLKLPLAIAYFKLAEIDPSLLTQSLTYSQSSDLDALEYFNASTPLVPGKEYTVTAMIERILKDSDNNVLPMLSGYINKDIYNKVLVDLGVDVPTEKYGGIHADFFSAKNYKHGSK